MGAKLALAHAYLEPSAEVVDFDVPADRSHGGVAGKAFDGDIAMPGGDRGHRAVGDLDGQVGTAIVPVGGAQGYVLAVDGQLRSQRLQVAPGFAVIRRVHHLVGLHVDLIIPGGGHGHVPVGHLDLHQRTRWDLPVQVLVGIVFLAEQVGEDIVLVYPMPEEVHAVKVAVG